MHSDASPDPRAPITFADGLGDRVALTEAGSPAREVLRLSQELSARPEFELALRERTARLATLHHDALARTLTVQRDGDGRLTVVGERAPGVRLSTLLQTAEDTGTPVSLDTALCLIRQLFPVVSELHQHLSGGGHGAIAPERIVVAPDGRLALVEHTLGSGLERLQYSRDRYWKDLRVALPQAVGLSRFDARADVTQLGAVALALLLGRAVRPDEYPGSVLEAVNAAVAGHAEAGASESLAAGLRDWLVRTLQLDPRRAVTTVADVKSGLEHVVGHADPVAEPRALAAFLARCTGRRAAAVAPVASQANPPSSSAVTPRAATATSDVSATTPAPVLVPGPSSQVARPTGPGAAVPPPLAAEASAEAPDSTLLADSLDVPADPLPEPVVAAAPAATWPRSWLIGAAVALIAITTGAAVFGRQWLGTPSGTLVVGTNPQGVAVLIDGQNAGVTPLTVELTPGPHVLELVTETEHRRTTVTITPDGQVSQFLELPKHAPDLGDLQVRTEPDRAKVTVDGHFFGLSPIVVKGLSPGAHRVLLENESSSVTEDVTIEPGTTAALLVPMTRPQSSFASGWIAVSAPADLQVYENNRLIGSSRSDRIMMAVGRHELELVNETLGFRATRTIEVSAGQVSPIRPEWPKGTVALNALPWAEVFIAGERIGETPIGSVSLPVGSHEIVFRHPDLGERRATATVTTGPPARVSVDFRK